MDWRGPEWVVVAAVGDVHGLHDRMVETLTKWSTKHQIDIDLVLQVGDFEPHRHEEDLRTMSAPSKYKHLGDFHAYARGHKRFPWPVYFIGGNHEPHGWLETQPEGFELLNHCHYLGRAGVCQIEGMQVGYLSGIFGEAHYDTFRPPIEALAHVSNKQYIYFNRADVERVFESAQDTLDVLLVHEWPADLFTQEAWFARRSGHRQRGLPGNAPARMLVDLLEPKLVFAGHMHTRLNCIITHESGQHTVVAGLGHMGTKLDACCFFAWHRATKSYVLWDDVVS